MVSNRANAGRWPTKALASTFANYMLAIMARVTLAAFAAYLLFNVFALYKYGGAGAEAGASKAELLPASQPTNQPAGNSFICVADVGFASQLLHFINYASCSLARMRSRMDGHGRANAPVIQSSSHPQASSFAA